MKEDIKKKFLDILFESEKDEGEVIVDEPIQDVKLSENTQKFLNAKDYLYSKNKRSSFITLNPKEKEEDNEKKEQITFISSGDNGTPPSPIHDVTKEDGPFIDDQYVMKPSISPMFGIIKQPDVIKQMVPKQETLKKDPIDIVFESKQTNKVTTPLKKYHDSYLGTIISPIFGYDVKNDLSNTMNLSIHKVESNYEPLEDGEEEAMSYYVKEKDLLDGMNYAVERNDHCSIKQIDEKTIKKEVKKQIDLEEETKEEEELIEEENKEDIQEVVESSEEEIKEEPIEDDPIDKESYEEPEEEYDFSFDTPKEYEPIDSLEEYFDRRLEEEVRGVSFDEPVIEEETEAEETKEEEFVSDYEEEGFEEYDTSENREEVSEEVDDKKNEAQDTKEENNIEEKVEIVSEAKDNEDNLSFNEAAFGEETSSEVPASVYKDVLNEERGFANTEEIDLFEDLFKEDEE